MRGKRGPYKQYLLPGSSVPIAANTKRRRREEAERMQTLFNNAQLEKKKLMEDDENVSDGDDIQETAGQAEEVNGLADDSGMSSQDASTSLDNTCLSDNEEVDDEYNYNCNNDEEAEGHTFQYLQSIITQYSEYKPFSINFTLGEILFLLITFALIHDLTLSALTDLLQIFNVLCATSLFPNSKFKLQRLINPCKGMIIHFTCDNCGHYLDTKKKGVKEIQCRNCNKVNNVFGYRHDSSFIIVDVKSQLTDILLDPTCKFSFNTQEENNIISDINCGSMYQRKVPESNEVTKNITFTFNSDGSPISKDGKSTVTPIFLMINELDYKVRSKNMVLAGLWYGRKKPRMDIFLKPFVEQMNKLNSSGFSITNNGIKTKIVLMPLCCVVDTVARSPMQGIKSVNGYFCCSWCLLKGKNIGEGPIKYPNEVPQPAPRTEGSFKIAYNRILSGETRFDVLKGVSQASPLLNLSSFSMVWGFVPDHMHLNLLGVSYRFIENWFSHVQNVAYIGTPRVISALDKILKNIKVPKLLKRDPTLITNKNQMKSRELENWFFFYSIPLLKGYLERKFYNHWKLIVNAVYMLIKDEVTLDDVDTAELLLLDFVKKTNDYYGTYEMTYNVHQLSHLAESVRRWGPLWAHTAYPFESAIGNIKTIIKSTKGVPQQIIRNIELSRARNVIFNTINVDKKILKQSEVICGENKIKITTKTLENETFSGFYKTFENHALLPNDTTFLEFKKVIKNGVLYKSNIERKDTKKDDSFVELHDGSFAKIKHILCSDSEPKIAYVILETLLCDDEPGISYIKRIMGRSNATCCRLSDVKCVAVHVFVDTYNEYICSIPYKHYIMNM